MTGCLVLGGLLLMLFGWSWLKAGELADEQSQKIYEEMMKK